MCNSSALPTVSLVIALLLGLHVAIDAGRGEGPLTELQLGEVAVAITLVIFGLQGLISVLVEGRELTPGRVPARLSGGLSVGIVGLSIVFFANAIALGYGIAAIWALEAIGSLAGVGCIVLSLLLVFYKEAFIGDQANFDNRKDGVPW